MSDDLVILPDWLAAMSEWLRDQPEVVDLVDDRVYTVMPRQKVFPLVVVTQVTDPAATTFAHWAVRALFQFDVWGGPQSATWTIAETIRALLSQRFAGNAWDLTAGAVVAGKVTVGGIRRTTENAVASLTEADGEVNRAAPLASFDAAAVLHPGLSSGS